MKTAHKYVFDQVLFAITFIFVTVRPSQVSVILYLSALLIIFLRGFYLESLAGFAAIKGYGSWYLAGALPLLQAIKLPLLILALFVYAYVRGMNRKLPRKYWKVWGWTLSLLILISLLGSHDPLVSSLKIVSIYIGYSLALMLGSNQTKTMTFFIPTVIIGCFFADVLSGFKLFMPHRILEGVTTDFYSSVWTHSQSAGVIVAALFLVELMKEKKTLLQKIFFVVGTLYLGIVLLMTKCRTAILGLFLTLTFFIKNKRIKLFVIFFGVATLIFGTDLLSGYLSKGREVSLNGPGEFISSIYNTRIEKMKAYFVFEGPDDFFWGTGFGIGAKFSDLASVYGEGLGYQEQKQLLMDEQLRNNRIQVFGFSIPLSSPVEYGNLYMGVFSGVGLLGFVCFVCFFYQIYQLLGATSKEIFKLLLVFNLAEAILLSPTGNPIMLFILCLLAGDLQGKIQIVSGAKSSIERAGQKRIIYGR